MSVHLDIKSESQSQTEGSPAPELPSPPSPRRVTLLEQLDFVQKLTPELIVAIQRELLDQRMDFERQSERRVSQLLMLAANERIDMERLRLETQNRWEEATGSTAASRSPSK